MTASGVCHDGITGLRIPQKNHYVIVNNRDTEAAWRMRRNNPSQCLQMRPK
jgi:hypothetical protein